MKRLSVDELTERKLFFSASLVPGILSGTLAGIIVSFVRDSNYFWLATALPYIFLALFVKFRSNIDATLDARLKFIKIFLFSYSVLSLFVISIINYPSSRPFYVALLNSIGASFSSVLFTPVYAFIFLIILPTDIIGAMTESLSVPILLLTNVILSLVISMRLVKLADEPRYGSMLVIIYLLLVSNAPFMLSLWSLSAAL